MSAQFMFLRGDALPQNPPEEQLLAKCWIFEDPDSSTLDQLEGNRAADLDAEAEFRSPLAWTFLCTLSPREIRSIESILLHPPIRKLLTILSCENCNLRCRVPRKDSWTLDNHGNVREGDAAYKTDLDLSLPGICYEPVIYEVTDACL